MPCRINNGMPYRYRGIRFTTLTGPSSQFGPNALALRASLVLTLTFRDPGDLG